MGRLILVCASTCTQHTIWGYYCIKYIGFFDFTLKSMGPNLGGFGSNLSCNISPNTTKFFTHVLTYHISSDRYVSKFYKQSLRMGKIMTIYSTAQPIKHTENMLGYFHLDGILCRLSYACTAQCYSVSVILFLIDRGGKGTQSESRLDWLASLYRIYM